MSTSHATGTSDPLPQADRLRQEMRTIRRELGQDVEDLVEHAERLMEWRYYVRRYPWASLGVAALLGYFIIPQRIVTLPTDDHTLSKLADRLPIQPRPERKKQSLLGWLVSMGTGMALRAAGAYVTQQLGKAVAQQQSTPRPEEMHHHG
jgi:hypothetical protein